MALRLAVRHDARLTGLFSAPLLEADYVDLAAGRVGQGGHLRQQREDACRDLSRHFRDAAISAGVEAEWCAPEGPPDVALPLYGRYADLIVAGQRDPDESGALVAPYFVENLLLSSGRPALLVPYAGNSYVTGSRPMIAWDGSRAAARAWHDALPLLKQASHVMVMI